MEFGFRTEPLFKYLLGFAALFHFKDGLVDEIDKILVALSHAETVRLIGELDIRDFKLILVGVILPEGRRG